MRLDPNFAAAYNYNNRGAAYYNKGNYDKAIADFSQAIRLKPNFPDAFFNRGSADAKKGNKSKAKADYAQALRLRPDLAEVYHKRGSRHGVSRRAIAYYDKAITLDSNFAQAYYYRGNVYSRNDDYDKAIADYSQAIKLGLEIYTRRGDAYLEKGDLDKAIADFDEAIRLNYAAYRKDVEAGGLNSKLYYLAPSPHILRADAYLKKGDYGKAIAGYEEALWVDYGNEYSIEAVMKLERALKLQAGEDAPADFSNAGFGYHSNCKSRLYCAKSYAYSASTVYSYGIDFDKAIRYYDTLIIMVPTYANAFYNRGMAHYKNGGYDKAIADYNEAARLNLRIEKLFESGGDKLYDYRMSQLYTGRGDAYFKKGDYDAAIADYDRCLRLDPHWGHNASFMRGEAHFKKGNFELAIADYSDVLRYYGDGIPRLKAYIKRGRAYLSIGNVDKAIADFEAALKEYPKNTEAKRYLEQARKKQKGGK
jgi:tetratricopeptide (TPR) repeat protein